jgi:hypothetical protein
MVGSAAERRRSWGIVVPSAALAATPGRHHGRRLEGHVLERAPQGIGRSEQAATTYYFQFGTTIALGTQTAPVAVGNGDKAVRAAADLTGLAPVTKYYYRIVATTTRAQRSASGVRSRPASNRSGSR